MAKVETLTAYKCNISYLQRNNPMIAEHSALIKAGKTPEYTFSDFIKDYIASSSELIIGENTDRAILLSGENTSNEVIDGNIKKWHLTPSAGKQGKPFTAYKPTIKKQYSFNRDSVALYEHHVFAYEKNNYLIIIFYRQNGSGCKSVFLETANKILKPKGLKLEMDLYLPPSDNKATAVPTKITLQYTKNVLSSDPADNLKGGKQKEQIVCDLGLNLEVQDNIKIFKIFRDMQLDKIDQQTAFALIKAECPNAEKYNDAEIQLRIGKRPKKIKWNEFEGLVGSYDITQKLLSNFKRSGDFISALSLLSDEYYNSIKETEVMKDAK